MDAVPLNSEIPEGLTNHPVYSMIHIQSNRTWIINEITSILYVIENIEIILLSSYLVFIYLFILFMYIFNVIAECISSNSPHPIYWMCVSLSVSLSFGRGRPRNTIRLSFDTQTRKHVDDCNFEDLMGVRGVSVCPSVCPVQPPEKFFIYFFILYCNLFSIG